uniref:TATA-box-binding protein n=1 Tax=Panagrolaimus davidi TaxID=227884 RepID=A0A914PP53_9BILA
MSLKIVNVVANFSLGKHLDLATVAQKLWNVEYNPCKFGAVILRQRNPTVTVLLFNRGKIVCTGAHSIVDCFLACKKLVRKLKRVLKVAVKMNEWKVRNVVASFKLDHRVNLVQIKENVDNGLFSAYNITTCHYEPELFSALQIKIPNRSILIFTTGRIILTGFIDPIELNAMYDNLKKAL